MQGTFSLKFGVFIWNDPFTKKIDGRSSNLGYVIPKL